MRARPIRGPSRRVSCMNLEDTLAKCKEFGFNEDITRETLWNTAYLLGRSRWFWGPMWWVDLKCWFRSKLHR